MPPLSNNIGLQDFNVFLYIVEGLTWVLVIGIILQWLSSKQDSVMRKFRNLLLAGFVVWGIAFLGQRVVSTYIYFHLSRPALQRTQQQYTGL
jgi:hypothetical protein